MIKGVKRPTVRLSDVAKLARCSAATVSRVLNAPETVNSEARLRVEAAVDQLGYMRNGAARALRSRRNRIVGIVLPLLDQPIYSRLLEALEETLSREGYSLIITTSDFSLDKELYKSRLMIEQGVDGLVLLGHTHLPALYTLLTEQNIHYVNIYTYKPELEHPSIGFDNQLAMVRVTDYLLDLGHRDFGLITSGRHKIDRAAERVAGIRRALTARGVTFGPEDIAEEDFTMQGGRAGLRRLLDGGRSPPTALICANDVIASGVLLECSLRGIKVPDDMSVVGFDNIESSAYFNPPLTTLEVPAIEMGRRAGEYLLARFDGRPYADHTELDTRLVVRHTTAPPPLPTCLARRQA